MKIVNDLTSEHVDYWAEQNPVTLVMRAPEGMDDCADCSAIATTDENGVSVVRVAWKPDEVDLAHLARGGTIWLSTWGGLPPHMLEVQAP